MDNDVLTKVRVRPVTRGEYFVANAFEGMIALLAIVSALVFFFDPATLNQTPIGHYLHPWDTLWNVLYLASGVSIIGGLVWGKEPVVHNTNGVSVEIMGLVFLFTAVLVNLVAIIAVVGANPGVFSGVAICLACIARIQLLWRYRHVRPGEVLVQDGGGAE